MSVSATQEGHNYTMHSHITGLYIKLLIYINHTLQCCSNCFNVGDDLKQTKEFRVG